MTPTYIEAGIVGLLIGLITTGLWFSIKELRRDLETVRGQLKHRRMTEPQLAAIEDASAKAVREIVMDEVHSMRRRNALHHLISILQLSKAPYAYDKNRPHDPVQDSEELLKEFLLDILKDNGSPTQGD